MTSIMKSVGFQESNIGSDTITVQAILNQANVKSSLPMTVLILVERLSEH